MVMGIPGINLPNLTMLPESIRPIKHQTYKDRLDESLGMRRGPERNFRQSMADRREESMAASLGRYGESGLPSLAPRKTILGKTIPRTTKGQFLPKPHKLPRPITAPVMPTTPKTIEEIIAQIVETEPGTDTVGPPGTTISPIQEAVDAAVGGGTGNKYGFTPGDPTKMYPQVMVPWVNKETGERYTAPNPGYQPPPGSAWEEAGYGGIPGFNQPDPVQEAVDAAVGGGRDPWENHLPSDHPFWQSPEFLAHQEKNKDFIGLTFLDPYPASDGTIFTDNLGEVGKLYDQWLINQQNQADPVQDAVDAAIGGGTTPQTGNKYGFIPPPPDAITTQALLPYYNPTTGETFTAGSGGWTAPEGWVHGNKPADWTPPTTDPVVGGETPVADEVSVMNQLQAMIDQILAQQAEQQTAQQQAQQQQAQQAQNYTLSGSRIGYNPYTSGQYQADPYGAAGVPDMGGLTTIPVPQPLTGIGYANYQAPENMT